MLIFGWLLVCGQLLFAVSPEPKWELPVFPRRAVFTVPRYAESGLLVRLPREKTLPDDPGFAAYGITGLPLSFQTVFSDASGVYILLDIRDKGRGGRGLLYYGVPAKAPGTKPQTVFNDPQPVSAEVHRPGGQSLPNTWEKMFFLYSVSGAAISVTGHPGFGNLDLFKERAEPRHRTHSTNLWLSRVRSYFLCPETGTYRIGLDCAYTGFLLVDGNLAAGRTSQVRPEPWGNPSSLMLTKGLHLLEVFAFSDADLLLQIGWSLPGKDTITPLPDTALVAAFEAQDSRIECSDRTLHCDFQYSLLPASRFKNKAPVLIPVTFRNHTENWVTETMKCRWDFGDATSSEEENPVHLYSRPGIWKVSLTVTDNLGFIGQGERMVDCRLVQPKEYGLDTRILYLPSICYESDVIEPVFELTGRTPDSADLVFTWKMVKNNGQMTQDRKEIKATGTGIDVQIPLVKAEAGSFNRIEWQIMLGDVVLNSGRMRFLRPPYVELPTRVEGDRLLDAHGDQLILIPVRGAGRVWQPPIDRDMAGGKIFCLDDTLALSGLPGGSYIVGYDRILARLLGQPDSPDICRIDLSPKEDSFRDVYAPLAKLVRLPQLFSRNAGVAIITVGLQDMLNLVPPDQFERSVGALCDLLYSTLNCPVVLVTLPPYPPDTDRIKPYAAAIRKVADARSMPVADLYTGFLGMSAEGRRSFFRNNGLGLSESGQHLAAQLIIRALLAESRGNR